MADLLGSQRLSLRDIFAPTKPKNEPDLSFLEGERQPDVSFLNAPSATISPSQLGNSFSRGFGGGLAGSSGSVKGYVASGLAAAGFNDSANELFDSANRDFQQAGEILQGNITDYRDVKGFRDAAEFALGAAGQGIATTIPAIAGTAIGAAATRSPVGAFMGGAAAMTPLEGGETAMAIRNDPTLAGLSPRDAFLAATGKGVAGAALEEVVPFMAGQRIIRPGAFGGGVGGVAKRVGSATAQGMGVEALTEAAQQQLGNEVMSGLYRSQGETRDRSEDLPEVINAALMGAVGGGVMTGTAQALGEVGRIPLGAARGVNQAVRDPVGAAAQAGDALGRAQQAATEAATIAKYRIRDIYRDVATRVSQGKKASLMGMSENDKLNLALISAADENSPLAPVNQWLRSQDKATRNAFVKMMSMVQDGQLSAEELAAFNQVLSEGANLNLDQVKDALDIAVGAAPESIINRVEGQISQRSPQSQLEGTTAIAERQASLEADEDISDFDERTRIAQATGMDVSEFDLTDSDNPLDPDFNAPMMQRFLQPTKFADRADTSMPVLMSVVDEQGNTVDPEILFRVLSAPDTKADRSSYDARTKKFKRWGRIYRPFRQDEMQFTEDGRARMYLSPTSMVAEASNPKNKSDIRDFLPPLGENQSEAARKGEVFGALLSSMLDKGFTIPGPDGQLLRVSMELDSSVNDERLKGFKLGRTKEGTEVTYKDSMLGTSGARGSVEEVRRFTRQDVINNPDKIYVFGDNLRGSGTGGQAVIRGLPNAVGVPTKYTPTTDAEAYFGKNIEAEKLAITAAIDKLIALKGRGKTIILPADGLGTGRAELATRAPEVFEHLNKEISRLRKAPPKKLSSENWREEKLAALEDFYSDLRKNGIDAGLKNLFEKMYVTGSGAASIVKGIANRVADLIDTTTFGQNPKNLALAVKIDAYKALRTGNLEGFDTFVSENLDNSPRGRAVASMTKWLESTTKSRDFYSNALAKDIVKAKPSPSPKFFSRAIGEFIRQEKKSLESGIAKRVANEIIQPLRAEVYEMETRNAINLVNGALAYYTDDSGNANFDAFADFKEAFGLPDIGMREHERNGLLADLESMLFELNARDYTDVGTAGVRAERSEYLTRPSDEFIPQGAQDPTQALDVVAAEERWAREGKYSTPTMLTPTQEVMAAFEEELRAGKWAVFSKYFDRYGSTYEPSEAKDVLVRGMYMTKADAEAASAGNDNQVVVDLEAAFAKLDRARSGQREPKTLIEPSTPELTVVPGERVEAQQLELDLTDPAIEKAYRESFRGPEGPFSRVDTGAVDTDVDPNIQGMRDRATTPEAEPSAAQTGSGDTTAPLFTSGIEDAAPSRNKKFRDFNPTFVTPNNSREGAAAAIRKASFENRHIGLALADLWQYMSGTGDKKSQEVMEALKNAEKWWNLEHISIMNQVSEFHRVGVAGFRENALLRLKTTYDRLNKGLDDLLSDTSLPTFIKLTIENSRSIFISESAAFKMQVDNWQAANKLLDLQIRSKDEGQGQSDDLLISNILASPEFTTLATPDVRVLSAAFRKIIPPDLKLEFDWLPDGVLGVHNISKNSESITLDKSLENRHKLVHTFLHEVSHAATISGLYKNPELREDLTRLMIHIGKKNPKIARIYGMTNMAEFLAEGLTNPRMRAMLRKTEPMEGGLTIKSAWDSFVNIIRQALGLNPNEHNALSQFLELASFALKESADQKTRDKTLDGIYATHDNPMTALHAELKKTLSILSSRASGEQEVNRIIDLDIDMASAPSVEQLGYLTVLKSRLGVFKVVSPNATVSEILDATDKVYKAWLAKAMSEMSGEFRPSMQEDSIPDSPEQAASIEDTAAETTSEIAWQVVNDRRQEVIDLVRKRFGNKIAVVFSDAAAMPTGVSGMYESTPIYDSNYEGQTEQATLESLAATRRSAIRDVRKARELKGDELAAFLDGRGYESINDIFARIRNVERELAAVRNGEKALGVITLAANFNNILTLTDHETMHAAFDILFTPAERRILAQAFTQGAVLKKVKDFFKDQPAVLAQIESSTEEAIAYGFQLYVADPTILKAGPQVTSLFQKMKDFLSKLFNMLSPQEKATIILNDFISGNRKDTMQSPIASRLPRNATVMQKLAHAGKTVGDGLYKGYQAALENMYNRLDDTQNPAIQRIARMGYKATGTEGKQGFIQNWEANGKQRMNEFAKIISKYDESTIGAAHNVLIREQNRDSIQSPEVAALVREIDTYLKGMREYQREAGVKMGTINEKYYPLIWDADKVSENRDAFIAMLQQDKYKKHFSTTMKTPQEIADSIVADLERGEDFQSIIGADKDPVAQSTKQRTLGFIAPEDRAPFVGDSLNNTMTTYILQATRKAEYNRAFGSGGEKLIYARQEAKNVYGATQQELEMVDTYIDGLLGNREVGMSRELRDMLGSVMVYENWRLLPLNLLSSLVDPLGVAIRTNNLGEAWSTFSYSIKNLFRDLKERGDMDKDKWEMLSEDWGVIERNGIEGNVHHMYESIALRGMNQKANDMLFKYNLVNGWVKSNKIMAVAAANRFLARVKEGKMFSAEQNQRYLNELGLSADDIFIDSTGSVITKASDLKAAGATDPEALEEKIRQAHLTVVNQSILNPNAAEKPGWGSNPYFSLLFQLKSFVFSFQQNILGRLMYEAENGNYKPLLMSALYVPGMMAADFIRGMIVGWGEEPPWKENWEFSDYFMYGVERSGLTGVGSFFSDMQSDIGYGGRGYESFMGPAVSHGIDFVSMAGGEGSARNFVVKALPAAPLFQYQLMDTSNMNTMPVEGEDTAFGAAAKSANDLSRLLRR